MSRETIDQLARRLAESLPQGAKAVRKDLEENFRGVLSAGLHRLDLVTREEFDVQQAVLARTRTKLEALEARLAELETAKVASPKATTAKKPRKKAAKRKTKKKKKKSAAATSEAAGKSSAKTARDADKADET